MKKVLFILIIFLPALVFAQTADVEKALLSGNDYYKKQQYAKASEEYRKALNADPSNITAAFNQANALYKQDKKVDAAIILTDVVAKTTDAAMRAQLYYNKGVILTQQKSLEESIEAYKNALRNDPKDLQARENLQKALLELKKKEEQKKKENDEKKKKKEDQKKQPQPKMNPKEAEQRLKLLQQKEKETQQRVQREKTKTGGSQAKDW